MLNYSPDKKNLCGVVVLYNPDSSVIDHIKSYVDELSQLFVIDNSESLAPGLRDAICSISPTINYFSFGRNKGIAMALNEGCRLGVQNGYHWILTMDQDSQFVDGEFFEKIRYSNYPNAAILAASYNQFYFRKRFSTYPDMVEVGFVITSGNVLNLSAWEKTGAFLNKFFIDEVDNEFCVRARLAGYKILATNDVFLVHKLGENLDVKSLVSGKQLQISEHAPVRIYYIVRNNLYLWRQFAFREPRFVANRIRNIMALILKIIFYYPEKMQYFNKIRKAVVHAVRGRYGKFVE